MTSANRSKPQGPLVQGDPIVGIRIGLNPIVLRPGGETELLGEIAAKVFDMPMDWAYLQLIETRMKGLTIRGELDIDYGPAFDMVPDSYKGK